jgi:dTDP-4-amino-4,6-dideoxygalactose transaminase
MRAVRTRSCRTAGKVRKFNFEPGSNSMATIQPRQRLYDINNSGFLLAVATNTLNDADDGHFKEVFCSFAGVDDVIPLPRGRLAVYFAVKHAVAQSGRRKVLLSAFTIFDLINMVYLAGGTPLFVDIEPRSPHLAPGTLEAAIDETTAAVIVTHYHTANHRIQEIAGLCARKGVMLIEDCAIALGARIKDQHVGAFGDVGMYSFGLFKPVCTYFGGAMVAKSRALRDSVREQLAGWPVMRAKEMWPNFIKGLKVNALTQPTVFNYFTFPVFRLGVRHDITLITNQSKNDPDPVLRSTLPLEYERRPSSFQLREWARQLAHAERHREIRLRNARAYHSVLRGVNWLTVPSWPDDNADSFLNFPILVEEDRDTVVRAVMEAGFDCTKYYYRNCAMIDQFAAFARSLPNLQHYVDHVVVFPTHPSVPLDYVERLSRVLVQL